MATNEGGVTHLGQRWEIRHSIWMLWIFTLGFFNWVGFLYVGIRSRNQAWVAWGAFYSVPFILAMIFAERNQAIMSNVVVPLTVILGVAGIVHAFRIRPHYLRRLAARQRGGARPGTTFYPSEQRRQSPPASGVPAVEPPPTSSSVDHSPAADPQRTAATTSRPDMALDLNRATEGELASLPGVGPVLAKRAVAVRAERAGFGSVDELGHVLDLKPHVVERLRPLLTVGPRPEQTGGRTGRLVDF